MSVLSNKCPRLPRAMVSASKGSCGGEVWAANPGKDEDERIIFRVSVELVPKHSSLCPFSFYQ